MNCREARQHFSPWLDGELADAETCAVREHLASCGLCAAEMEKLRAISAVLQSMRAQVAPPEDFAARVMARLRRDEAAPEAARVAGWRSWWRGVKTGWKKSVAVAAALFVLLAGSAGVAARYFGMQGIFGPPAVVYNESTGNSGENGGENAAPGERISAPDAGGGEGARGAPENPETAGSGNQDSSSGLSGAGSKTGTGKDAQPGAGSARTQVAFGQPAGEPAGGPGEDAGTEAQQTASASGKAASAAGPKAFLNQPRAIESIFIKVQVDNLDEAAKRLTAEARARGITYSVDQKVQVAGGKAVEIFRFAAPRSQAEQFAAYVSKMGQLLSSSRETRDVSNEFAEKLSRYQSLVAERKTAGGEQAGSLDAEIKKLEEELTAMDREAREQVIIIAWLEQ